MSVKLISIGQAIHAVHGLYFELNRQLHEVVIKAESIKSSVIEPV